MKKHLVVIAALLLMSVPLLAQDSYRGQGYVFYAPGGSFVGSGGSSTPIFHVGGGGEGFIHKGFAAGGEISYVAPYEAPGDGVGVFSVNGAYHFKAPDRKVVPFVTGGYSLAFRDGSLNGMNFGGGATWWFKEKYGFRLEVRDNYFPQDPGWHQLGVRIGLSFR